MINEELMPIAWHPKRWFDWSLPEDGKKEIEPIFIIYNQIEPIWLEKCALVVHKMGGFETFLSLGVLNHFGVKEDV